MGLPPELAPLVDRLVEGRITVTSMVDGELSRAEALRFLMADRSVSDEQVAEWDAGLDDLVHARRMELLGDRAPAYQVRLAEYLASAPMGNADAQIAAYRDVMAMRPAATPVPAEPDDTIHATIRDTVDDPTVDVDTSVADERGTPPAERAAQPHHGGATLFDSLPEDVAPDAVKPEAVDPRAQRLPGVGTAVDRTGHAQASARQPVADRPSSLAAPWQLVVVHRRSGHRAQVFPYADDIAGDVADAMQAEQIWRALTPSARQWINEQVEPGDYQIALERPDTHGAARLWLWLAERAMHAGEDLIAGWPELERAFATTLATSTRENFARRWDDRLAAFVRDEGDPDALPNNALRAGSLMAELYNASDGTSSLYADLVDAGIRFAIEHFDTEPIAEPAAVPDAVPHVTVAEATPEDVAAAAEPVPRFRPAGQHDLAPSTPLQRARANIAALRVLAELRETGAPVTTGQQQILARWGGWGSVPQIFDDDNAQWAAMRTELRELLDDEQYRAAARTTINAHYTDAAFVAEVWTAMRQLGFTGGQVLEPGSGSGVFVGLAPDGAQMTGVELDPATAEISRLLYPHARILNESFAVTRAPSASFDATVGNVPFGDVVLHDPRYNPHRLSIHNHFLVKAMDLLKPGGLMAMVTSAYTMDAQNPATRRLLAQQADLIGAIRLPSRAHRAAAGTDALTDIVLLRRREPGREPDGVEWELSAKVAVGEHELRLNEYFVNHPHHVLGELITGDGLYREAELSVRGPVGADLIEPLRAALAEVTESAQRRGLTFAPAESGRAAEPVMLVGQHGRPEGHIQVTESGGFDVVHSGVVVAHEVPASQAGELRMLLELRDLTMGLLSAEAATFDDTEQIADLRVRLGRRYDTYVARYGPINRYSQRNTGRVDPQTGQPKTARVRPPQGRFREDTYAAAVFALEHFDGETQTARKVDLFSQRVVAPRPVRQGADNAADALAIVMDLSGRVDLEHVAELLGVEPDEARTMLGDLVYPDPAADGQLVPAAAYLSGNVRTKLAQARLAADTDPQYESNVAALQEIVPEDIQPVDIHAALGAVWIRAEYVQQFLREVLQDNSVRVVHPGSTIWVVEGGDRGGVQSTEVWGTSRMPAVKIAAAMLEQRTINVYDVIDTPDGERRILNAEATAAAREKGRELNERFGEWIWEDPARADELVRTYNTAFNGLVLRNYDNPQLSLPGLAASFTLRPHQLAAVARIIAEPAVLLAHEVGAGKTLEMICGAMELRRLGLVRKPAVVIPNHMIEQFAREWLQAYPQAKILLVTRDDLSTADKRKTFVARAATGDWDAVIMSRSAFERIPVSVAEQQRYLSQEMRSLQAQLDRLKAAEREAAGGDEPRRPSTAVKRMEKLKLQAEERLKKKLDSTKDEGIQFEHTGIDYCLIDEAHGYKNLRTVSNIQGAGIDGSQRATDVDMKLGYLRRTYGGRVATFATATPIANSVTEMYVMQKYLRPDLLHDAGIDDFDGWAATFGEVVASIELSPDGSGFRTNSRFAKFKNVPELLRMFWMAADIKTAEDLDLPTPLLAARPGDGARQPETDIVAPTQDQLDYIADLGRRAEAVRARSVEPEEDNMLKISSDGRKAALDMRMIDPNQLIYEPQKIDRVAERILPIWEQTRGNRYTLPSGQPHPRPGALQIVFLDLGTPGGKGFNAYEQLRGLLVDKGMPREAIRFIHEADNDRAKAEMFAACRDGRVAVIVGSSEKMGVGTNIQTRAIAMHQVDPLWKPADEKQEAGRILRQGNQNPEIQIIRYVTERTFDGYMWQTIARKQRFITQVMRGRLDVREIEDIGDAALSYSEVMAIAAGNPLLAAKARAEQEVQRLARLERAHFAGQASLDRRISEAERGISRATELLRLLSEAMANRKDTRGDLFAMYVGDRYFDQRAEAGRVLQAAIGALPRSQRPVELGRIGGFTFTGFVSNTANGPSVTMEIQGVPDVAASTGSFSQQVIPASVHLGLHEIQSSGATGFVQRLENRLFALERDEERMRATIERHERDAEQARAKLGAPFKHQEALEAAKAELDIVMAELAVQAEPPKPAEPVTTEEAQARVQAAITQASAGADGSAVSHGLSEPDNTVAPQRTPQQHPQQATQTHNHPPARTPASTPLPPDLSHVDEATRDAVQRLRSGDHTIGERLVAYDAAAAGLRLIGDADETLLRQDLARVTVEGTVAQRSRAQMLTERLDGKAFHPASVQAQAIAAVHNGTAAHDMLSMMAGLNREAFESLHPLHRTAIVHRLDHIAGLDPSGTQAEPGIGTRARSLLRTLLTGAATEPEWIRLVLTAEAAAVHGTRREDREVQQVLRDANFKWLPGQKVWGMNRTVLPETRQRNVARLIRAMRAANLELVVDDRRHRVPAGEPDQLPAATAIRLGLETRADALQPEQTAGGDPLRSLPNPAALRVLADQALIASSDGRFFAIHDRDAGNWTVHEATTGMRLTRPTQTLADQGAAQRAMQVLAATSLDFAGAAEQVGRPPYRVTDANVAARLNEAVTAAHTASAGQAPLRVASAHPQPVTAGMMLHRRDTGQPATQIREPANQMDLHR